MITSASFRIALRRASWHPNYQMKLSPQRTALALVALLALTAAGCNHNKPSDHPATVSSAAKEKHTKTKAHKRDKKKEKKDNGGKKPAKPGKATPAPATPTPA